MNLVAIMGLGFNPADADPQTEGLLVKLAFWHHAETADWTTLVNIDALYRAS